MAALIIPAGAVAHGLGAREWYGDSGDEGWGV